MDSCLLKKAAFLLTPNTHEALYRKKPGKFANEIAIFQIFVPLLYKISECYFFYESLSSRFRNR